MKVFNSNFKLTTLTATIIGIFALIPFNADAIGIKKQPKSVRVEKHVYHPNTSFQMSLTRVPDSDFRGGQLSVTHRFDRNNALRLNLGVYEQDGGFESDQVFESEFSSFAFEDFYFHNTEAGYISLQYLSYLNHNRKVNLFWGIGPRISAATAEPEPILDYYYTDDYAWAEWVDCTNNALVGLGLEGSIGMELFFGPNFSLLAEYGITLEQRWYLFEFEYYDDIGRSSDRWEAVDDGLHLNASQFRFGLAFHF